MIRVAGLLLLASVLQTGCGDRDANVPVQERPGPTDAIRAGSAREVFRLAPDGDGGLVATGVVPTVEGRALLLTEIGRNWPGRAVRAELVVEAGAPATWVSEAMALMPYAAGVDGGGLVVVAEPGRAGGGEIAITGRVPDEATLARLAADAAASVAPPFVVMTPLAVGLPRDSVVVADSAAALPLSVLADAGGESAAEALRTALAGSTISFQPGTTATNRASGPVLDRLAAALAAAPTVHVGIAAPGEGSGSGSLERALARRRAGALVEALVARGVEAARLVAVDPEEPPPTVTIRVSTPGA